MVLVRDAHRAGGTFARLSSTIAAVGGSTSSSSADATVTIAERHSVAA
jgi:hypothetical protein